MSRDGRKNILFVVIYCMECVWMRYGGVCGGVV